MDGTRDDVSTPRPPATPADTPSQTRSTQHESVDTTDLPPQLADSRDATVTIHLYEEGALPVEPVPPAAGYHLGETIGRGGLAQVNAAVQNSFRRRVALKTLRGDKSHQRAQFYAEARMAAMLQHPNILPIYDLIEDDRGKPQIVMKQVQGQTWAELLKQDIAERARLSQDYIRNHLAILMDVCQAVAYAHDHGVLHRDVKPSNVMIGDYGEVLLMDWGCAAIYAERPGMEGLPRIAQLRNIIGTPCYLAPEQARVEVEKQGPATDIYLLGATLYEILTGSPPHPGDDLKSAIAAAKDNKVIPFRPPEDRWDWPEELLHLAMRCMRTDPDDRPRNVYAFVQELQAFQLHNEARLLMRMARTQMDLAKREPLNAGERLRKAIGFAEEATNKWPEQSACHDLLFAAWLAAAKHAMESKDFTAAEGQAQTAGDLAKTPGQKYLAKRVHTDAVKHQTQVFTRQRMLGTMRKTIRVMTITLVLILVTMAIFAVFAYYHLQLAQQRYDHSLERENSLIQQLQIDQNQLALEHHAARLQLIHAAVERGAGEEALRELNDCSPRLRGWPWHHLVLRCRNELQATGRLRAGPGVRLAWRPRDRVLATGDAVGDVRLWPDPATATATVEPTLRLAAPVTCLGWTTDGENLLVGLATGEVARLTADGRLAWRERIADAAITVLLAAPTDSSFYCGAADGRVHHRQLDDRAPVAEPWRGDGPISALAVVRDHQLVVGTAQGLRVVNATDLGDSCTPAVGAPATRGLALGPSGAVVAEIRDDDRLFVVSLDEHRRPEVRCNLEGQPEIRHVAWNTIDGRLATAGADGTVRLWHYQLDFPPLLVLTGHGEVVTDLAFSADGVSLASADASGTVLVRHAPSLPGPTP